MLSTILKDGLTHQIMMKVEKRPLPTGKTKIGLMKGERRGKIITKCVTTTRKINVYRAQKYYHKIEGSELLKSKGVKKSSSKELIFHGFNKCVHNVTIKPIAKKEMNFRCYNYKIYNVNF